MESTCKRLLAHCLDGTPWPDSLLDETRRGLETVEGSRLFFQIVIERLGDSFEPALCDIYAKLMAELLGDPTLAERYFRIREPQPLPSDFEPHTVYVLSRVTIGADIAVTSVLLDAARKRYPSARIVFAGPPKNAALFPGVEVEPVDYGRAASFSERIAARPWLNHHNDPRVLVLDPDSRLSQLGLLPVCGDAAPYRLFESRSYRSGSNGSLTELASEWCREVLGGDGGDAWIAPYCEDHPQPPARITVNLGVGANLAKRLPDPFEAQLLALLPDEDTLVDLGGDAEEAARMRLAAGPRKRFFQGPFAGFAARISQSELFVGYDSAAMHAAAACGTPLLCIFAGAISDRFFERWKPTGSGPIRILRPEREANLLDEAARYTSGFRATP